MDHLTAAPLLETERLRLRSFRSDDLAASHAMWCEPTVYKYIAGKPSSREDAWAGILKTVGHWQLLGFGYWAIEHKQSSRWIGNIGYGQFHRDIVPDMDATPEAGWALATAFHGLGLASEALQTVLDWAKQNLAHEKTACIIAPENAASLKLAIRFGYKQVAVTTYKEQPTFLLQRNNR